MNKCRSLCLLALGWFSTSGYAAVSANSSECANGFYIQPVKMVAGKTEFSTIYAVNADCEIDQNYQGNKQLQFKAIQYVQPFYSDVISAPKHPELLYAADGGEVSLLSTFSLNFQNGVAQTDDSGDLPLAVRYKDVGRIQLVIEEIPENRSTAMARSGAMTIDASPYLLAVCDFVAEDESLDESSIATVAGASFPLFIKPVAFDEAIDDLSDSLINTDDSYCDRDESLPSFFQPDAPSVSIVLADEVQVYDPSPVDGGLGATLDGSKIKTNTDWQCASNAEICSDEDRIILFDQLEIHEVGYFVIQASLSSDYFDMTVTPTAYHSKRRFHPSHFFATSTFLAGVPSDQDEAKRGFTYFDQPFSAELHVQAFSAKDIAVKNYHLHNEQVTALADFSLLNNGGGFGQAWDDRWKKNETVTNWQRNNTDQSSEWRLSSTMMITRTAFVDGPYWSVKFALNVENNDRDKTNFRFCNDNYELYCNFEVVKELSDVVGAQIGESDFIFGRMQISGFAENQFLTKNQTMPVMIQYFNGDQFELNTRDSVSLMNTENISSAKVLLMTDAADYPDHQAKILLHDNIGRIVARQTVTKGIGNFHIFPPNQSEGMNREQFSWVQKLNENASAFAQPWLQYDWNGDQNFNDDPSAIGIFGFYKGSDRIIFRGEKNSHLLEE